VACIGQCRERMVEGAGLGIKPIREVLRAADVEIAPSTHYVSKPRPPRYAELIPVRPVDLVERQFVGRYRSATCAGCR
jgi:hypothetical protein